jgi:hypothetical protein
MPLTIGIGTQVEYCGHAFVVTCIHKGKMSITNASRTVHITLEQAEKLKVLAA